MSTARRRDLSAGIVANVLVFGSLAYGAVLFAWHPDFYQRSVQEDEYLEWTTFWAFLLAGIAFVSAALRDRQTRAQLPWFFAGLALFCGLVAMEEISWGQRLFAYRPPAYFLEHNFQQELNLHNVIEKDFRQLAFLAVVLGYGVALPLVFLLPSARRSCERIGIAAPSLLVAPAFVATGILYQVYPWSHTGEWAEAMLGLAMLCVALIHADRASARWLAGAGVAAGLLGLATASAWWRLSGDDPARIAATEVELRALRADFTAARTRTRCGLHKRVYTMVEKYHLKHLYRGEFALLSAKGLPQERAQFFLDPWNSPYWIQHECSRDGSRRAIFVYSFGPNRLRNSTDWEIVDDDLGAWVSRPEPVSRD
jgi:hypothetical protein